MSKLTIALVGCSKTKSVPDPSGYALAKDLYTSDLFRKRRAHVEGRGLPWYILSAKSGLLKPSVSVRNYDAMMRNHSEIERAEWHLGVANQIMSELYYDFPGVKLSNVTIEFHAGAAYCEPLGAILRMFGVSISKPLKGLGIGQQLSFYDKRASS